MKLKRRISGLLVIAMLITTIINVQASEIILGDVNQDGVIDLSDVTLIQKYLSKSVTLSYSQQIAADVNRDGVINMTDVMYVRSYVAGNISSFPDETVSLSSNTWTTISASAFKYFNATSNYSTSYEIEYENGEGWLSVTRSGSAYKVTVLQNNSLYTRKATVTIKANGKSFPITVKQLGDISYGNMYNGYAASYGYALNLTADPRSQAGKVVSYFNSSANTCKPGVLSSLDEYSIYNFDDITYINYGTDLITKFEEYTMNYVKADMKALGWTMKKVTSADYEVKEGNWLVALAFNPNEEIWAKNGGYPVYSTDYHWYKRYDNSDGTFSWWHKRGTTAIQTLGSKLPENECISLESYIASQNNGNIWDTNPGSFGYLFVGYYEVGPNFK